MNEPLVILPAKLYKGKFTTYGLLPWRCHGLWIIRPSGATDTHKYPRAAPTPSSAPEGRYNQSPRQRRGLKAGRNNDALPVNVTVTHGDAMGSG